MGRRFGKALIVILAFGTAVNFASSHSMQEKAIGSPFSALAGVSANRRNIQVWVSRDIAPPEKVRLSITTFNIPSVNVAAYPIDPIHWLRQDSQSAKPEPKPIGRAIKTWTVGVATKNNPPNPREKDHYYSRQVNLPPIPPGVYLLLLTAADAKAWAVVNVTDLAVIVKESSNHLLVWTTNALTGKVIPDASVQAYAHNGTLLYSGSTNAEGVLFAGKTSVNKNGLFLTSNQMIVVRSGKDYAGVPATSKNPDGQLAAHFQTDRPIYRPGQTIQFKSILRLTEGIGYRPIIDTDATVELRDPKNNPIDRVQLHSNAMGSIAGQLDIPEEGATGAYTLVLSTGHKEAYQTVTVAEYRKPEYKVDVTPLGSKNLAGQTIHFKVSAQYYFGAAVGQAEVRYTVRRSDLLFYDTSLEDQSFYGGDGNLYPRDTYSQAPFVAEDVVHTDNGGEATVEVKTDPNAPDSTYSIDVTATDSSRRQVTASSSMPVYAANIRISLSTSMVFVPEGKLIPIDVRAVDLDGKPVEATVTLILKHQVWNEKKNDFEVVELTRTMVHVPASGRLKATLPAAAEGDLMISATAPDGTGRNAKAELDTYAVGPFEKGERAAATPTIKTMVDRRSYSVGENVNAHVQVNTKGWPVLLVLEGQDIYSYKVVGGSSGWAISTNKLMSPNAYFTAAQWVKSELYSANTIVPLPDKSDLLNVQLTPDKKEYEPGDKATYRVRTTNRSGDPVSAEVAVNVVDAAIYALSSDNTEDVYKFYWGLRPDRVSMHQAAPEELSGGAYQRVSTVAPIRQRFEDTAYWNAFVDTDGNGDGSLSFEMPGNLTTWVAKARAVTETTAVGSAANSVVATRPVTLRLATPRQMVVGDRLSVIATVNNRTSEQHSFRVSVTPEGLKLGNEKDVDLTVPAKGEATVEFEFLADHRGSQPPAITAQAVCTDVPSTERADYSDALRMVFPVMPDGVPIRIESGGVVSGATSATLTIPEDMIQGATTASVKIWSGVKPAMEDSAAEIMRSYRYGTLIAVDQLEMAPLLGLDNSSKDVREALALLSRNQNGDGGWGYWQDCPSNRVVTSAVLRAFALVSSKIEVPESLVASAVSAAQYQYEHTNLWEYKALLASALAYSRPQAAQPWLDDIVKRGQNLSPYAKLRLAEAFLYLKKPDQANALIESVIPTVSVGPSSAFLPVGDGIGWDENSMETTAELESDLVKSGAHPDLPPKVAEWLVSPGGGDFWPSSQDTAAKALALNDYLAAHPATTNLGEATIQIGGEAIETKHAKVADELVAEIPQSLLRSGDNTFTIQKTGDGEAFYEITAQVYRPLRNESDQGIRVAKRYEVRNSAGIWEKLARPLKAGEVLRCTVLIWGDDVPDVVQLNDPLPAGFEFVDEDSGGVSETDVRDGAIVHYALTNGRPVFFTYYLRPESEGELTSLPASAEILRRPASRGQTSEERMSVVKP